MSNFLNLYRELQGTFPDLPEDQCKRFVNRAQRDAYDAWNWSFLADDTSFNIPAALSTGTISVTQGSNVIVASGAAAAVWATLGLYIPITSRALKINSDLPYQILAFDGINTVYVDRPVTSATATGLAYSMYRPYYAAPADFRQWVSVVDPVSPMNVIPGKKKAWLDGIDPRRSATGNVEYISHFKFMRAQTIPAFGANTDPVPLAAQQLFELWPGPTAAGSLYAYYKRRGADLIEDEDESPFDDNVLISRALYHCYRFVQVNVSKFAQVKDGRVAWTDLKRETNADYLFELGNHIKRDDNNNLASILGQATMWTEASLRTYYSDWTWGQWNGIYAGSYIF